MTDSEDTYDYEDGSEESEDDRLPIDRDCMEVQRYVFYLASSLMNRQRGIDGCLDALLRLVDYYQSAFPLLKAHIKNYQILRDCIAILACDIKEEDPMFKILSDLFLELTETPITTENAEKMLQESSGPMAVMLRNFHG